MVAMQALLLFCCLQEDCITVAD